MPNNVLQRLEQRRARWRLARPKYFRAGEEVKLEGTAGVAWERVEPAGEQLPDVRMESAAAGTVRFVMDRGGRATGLYSQGADRTVKVRKRPSRWSTVVAYLIAAVVPVVVVVAVMQEARQEGTEGQDGYVPADLNAAWLFAMVVVGVVLLLLQVAGGLTSLLKGTDGRLSTSKTMFATWSLLVLFGLSFLAGRDILLPAELVTCTYDSTNDDETAVDDTKCAMPGEWQSYLILLGVPAAAAVVAKAVTENKVEGEALQKTTSTSASALDLVRNDDDKLSLIDAQYLAFNVYALVFVAWHILGEHRVPDIPPFVLALTGTAAASYVLGKTVQTNRPAITAVLPSSWADNAGETLTIRGVNLHAPGGDRSDIAVKVGGFTAEVTAVAAPKRPDLTELTATVPKDTFNTSGTPTNTREQFKVVVVTDGGLETEGYDVTVTT